MPARRRGERAAAEEPQEVLEQRALELSQERPEAQQEALKVLLFRIGREHAGLSAEYVREVVRPQNPPARVPGTPDFVLGLVNLRGRIVACLDVGQFLGIKSRFAHSLPFMVVITYEDLEMGIAVDEVSAVMDVPTSEIEPPSSALSAERARFIKGVFYVRKRPLSLIDLESLVHSDQISQLREATV